MANLMLNHLGQIIGQLEDGSQNVKEARKELLNPLKTKTVSDTEAQLLESPFTEEECLQALNTMGKEKSPGCDGLTSKFFKEFWEKLKTPITKLANKAFIKGELDADIKRGLIKFGVVV